MNNGAVACADYVLCLVRDVDKELSKVEKYHLNKLATNYDLSGIISEQKHKHEKYREKIMCLASR